jgi:hypothetical protein
MSVGCATRPRGGCRCSGGVPRLPGTPTPSASRRRQARPHSRGSRRARTGVIVDTWHFFRGDGAWPDLEGFPVDELAFVQFSDGLPAGPDPGHDTLHRRARSRATASSISPGSPRVWAPTAFEAPSASKCSRTTCARCRSKSSRAGRWRRPSRTGSNPWAFGVADLQLWEVSDAKISRQATTLRSGSPRR